MRSARWPLSRPAVYAVLMLLPAAGALGCGGGKAKVTGTVELDGKPLHSGEIIFTPANGGPVVSAEITDGKYTAEGVPSGEVNVTVNNTAVKKLVEATKQPKTGGPKWAGPAGVKASFSKDPSKKGPSAEMNLWKGEGGGAKAEMPEAARAELAKQREAGSEAARRSKELADNYRPVPEKYNDAATSGLKTTIKSGSTTFDVKLTSQ